MRERVFDHGIATSIDRDMSEPGTEVTVVWGNFANEQTMEIKAKISRIAFIKQRRREDLTTKAPCA